MAKLKIEEMKAESEIEKQRFEERLLVMKEFQEKLDEIKEKIENTQAEFQQWKQNGILDWKSIGALLSAMTVILCKYSGLSEIFASAMKGQV